MVQIVQPVANRSCGTGGSWQWAVDDRGASLGGPATYQELFSLFADDDTKRLFRAELTEQMERAQQGSCTYGSAPNDVELMRATTDVLELRLGADWDFKDEGEIHVRLFFTEPARLPATLLGIRFFWKKPGPISKSDQTAEAESCSLALTRVSYL